MDYSLSTIKRINKRLKDKIIKILWHFLTLSWHFFETLTNC
jgi:hypothetical protein